MNRRDCLRRATLLIFGMALGRVAVLSADAKQLRVNLDQWSGIIFEHDGRTVTIPIAEIFGALADSRR